MLKIFVTSFGVTDRTGALGTNSYDNGSIDMPRYSSWRCS